MEMNLHWKAEDASICGLFTGTDTSEGGGFMTGSSDGLLLG